jgi:cytochrome b6-f complex iron-sulfur subunit
MAENKKMSTAEILAAARAAKAAKSEVVEAAPPADVTDTPAPKAVAPKPAAAKPAGAAGGRPSVAEIMALARAKKEAEQGGVAATPADQPVPKPAAAKAPVAKAPAEKPAVAKATTPKSLTRDTASILAAARTGTKPGPVSKADAPARPAAAAGPASTVVKAPPAKLATAPVLPPKPVKPVAKKGAEAEQDRRGFLEMALGSFMATGFTALSMTGGLFGLGLARFMFPNVLVEPPSRFKVGFREGFPTGKVETKYVAQYGVWVVNSDVGGQQQIYALKTVCTHLGCTPNWLEAEQKFKCPCHGSGFYKDGVNFEGPAPRPLERYAIRIADDGQLEIDKGRSYHEELGQWADPESYITV